MRKHFKAQLWLVWYVLLTVFVPAMKYRRAYLQLQLVRPSNSDWQIELEILVPRKFLNPTVIDGDREEAMLAKLWFDQRYASDVMMTTRYGFSVSRPNNSWQYTVRTAPQTTYPFKAYSGICDLWELGRTLDQCRVKDRQAAA